MPIRRAGRVQHSIFLTTLLLAAPFDLALAQPPSAHHPGVWTPSVPWPGRASIESSVHSVHVALLRGDTLFARPHSQVLTWGEWKPTSSDGGLWGWSPGTDNAAGANANLTPLAVAPPPYNLFCAGHTTVPDASGDLLIVSGTERGRTGEDQSARFSALTRQWTTSAMSTRRWYANGTVMADGRVLATGGNAGHHMLVFGGRQQGGSLTSEVKRYAITDAGRWDAPLTGSGPTWPAPREAHTLADKPVVAGHDGSGPYYMFGGKDVVGTRNDVWQLHLFDNDLTESYRWRQVPVFNPGAIDPRWRHGAVVAPVSALPDSMWTMYVFGGETDVPTAATLGDLWQLVRVPSLNRWEWTNLTPSAVGDVPSARSGHGLVWDEDNDRAILFGGQNADGSITDNSVRVLTFPGGVPTWKLAPVDSGQTPPARTRHAMAANTKASPSTGVVFGGITSGGGLSDELWEFTVTAGANPTTRWYPRTVPAGHVKPPARSDASIIVYTEFPTSYVVLGGELAGGGWDAGAWEYRFDDVNDWHPVASLAQGVRGQRAIADRRILTELQPEVYDPATGVWTLTGQKKKRQSFHMMFAASDGKLYSPGPNFDGKDSTWRYSPASGQWAPYALNDTEPLDDTVGGILFRPNFMMKCGGYGTENGRTFSTQLGLTVPPLRAWRASLNTMSSTRSDHVLNMLPTGEVLASGGQGQVDNNNADPEDDLPRKRPEIWDPQVLDAAQPGKQGYWYGFGAGSVLAEEPVTRGHHSSSVLLPDGRLLSAGGWDTHPDEVKKSVDQYSPPYLFRANGDPAFRPRLRGAQEHITWDQTFEVACLDPVVGACLIRPGATTHAFNQDCRYVPLEVLSQLAGDHRITLRAPVDANTAPPGNYLLFVLANDPVSGKPVPSVARWVNIGSVQTSFATWDTLAPAPVTDLLVTDVTASTQTVRWTAPADAGIGSSGRATRYELRWRQGTGMPTLDDFFTSGTSVASLPAPQVAGQIETFTVTGLQPGTYYFRLISRDGAGSDRNWSALSNEAETPQGGGCPFVDTRTAGGWEVENSILGRSLSGAMALDGYRLRHEPEVREGRVALRIRENEQELTTLDQLRLIAVDHAPGVHAYAVGGLVVLGHRVAAERVTTSTGVDITARVNGRGAGYEGAPGDTLLVEFAEDAALTTGLESSGVQTHDPYLEGDGGKCPPDCSSPLRSPEGSSSATGVDAQVLTQSGVLVQSADGAGGWRTDATRYPREFLDEAVLEGVGHGPLRLVFVGRHDLHFVGRLHETGDTFAATKLPLLSARHSRLGDVAAAMDTTGNLTSELAPGDSVHLEFGWVPPAEGMVREYLLLSHGVYTANLPARLTPMLPRRFQVHGVRPNPFTASAALHFDLPAPAHVRLEIMDAQGRRVATVADRMLAAGSHALAWDGRTAAGAQAGAGVYFYRLHAGDITRGGRFARVP